MRYKKEEEEKERKKDSMGDSHVIPCNKTPVLEEEKQIWRWIRRKGNLYDSINYDRMMTRKNTES